MEELTFTKDDSTKVSFWVRSLFEKLKEGKKYKIEVKELKKKRSLGANAYFWVLCDKLAEKTQIAKEDIYRSYVRNIGGVSDMVCVQDFAVEKLCSGWEHNGLGWLTDTLPSKLKGCTNVVLYYGSSTYDTKQMSDLIHLAIQDCNEQGIDTLTEQETAELIELEERQREEAENNV